MSYEAIYLYDDSGKKKEIGFPLIRKDGTDFIEDENGQLHQFAVTLNDRQLGLLTFVRVEVVPDPPPQPHDPERDALVARVNELLLKLPNYEQCLNRHPSIRRAVDKRFAGLSTGEIEQLDFLVEDEAARQVKEKKASEPPPEFTRYDLTLSFRGQDVGDLRIADPYTFGSRENEWNGQWLCYCSQCEREGQPTRLISSETILRMKVGYIPTYKCMKPCKRGKK